MLRAEEALEVEAPALRQPLLLRQERIEAVVAPPTLTKFLDGEGLVLGEGGPDLDEGVSVGSLKLE